MTLRTRWPMDCPDSLSQNFVRGDFTGLMIPAHAESLREVGAEFLTNAFRHFGSLAPDNRVARITHFEPFAGGNSGHKLILSVEYAREEAGLHSDLFVKFSRDYADVFRDRRRHELESEVHLATLSRRPEFPVHVPAAYFADFNRHSGTGILVTQRIAFGSGGTEPLQPKCMDHMLADPLAHYSAIVTALAQLAAAHKSGALSPMVEELFPFDPEMPVATIAIPWNEQQLRDRVARYAEFASRIPRLLPQRLAAPQFIAKFEKEAVHFLRHEAIIHRFLHGNSNFVALCHWNTNIDNAWFWRDATGTLRCGLLDWGLVRQMNVAAALWGGLSAAGHEIWGRHLNELLAHFAAELSAHGGPKLDIDELKLHLDLSVALLGLALMMDVPALVLSRLPECVDAAGPLDPVLRKSEVARCFLHVFTNFLSLWQTYDFGTSLDRMLQMTGNTNPVASDDGRLSI